MFEIMSASQAIERIPDGAWIGVNAFLALSNPTALLRALAEHFEKTSHPNDLKLFCSASFDMRNPDDPMNKLVERGGVHTIVSSHYGLMPLIMKRLAASQMEGYNLPLGVLSHCVRASASGKPWILSQVGLHTFVDPRVEGCGMNDISKHPYVHVQTIDSQDYLQYETPRIDVALIKGSSCDPSGNITFENEFMTLDALALAQATRANGGMVFVQVEGVTHVFSRPRNVIVPGVLVDAVVVEESPDSQSIRSVLSGDIHVPATHMDYYMSRLSPTGNRSVSGNIAAEIIGQRAACELRKGQIVNLGIGIPEYVGIYASRNGILKDLTVTVESGGIGGLPAPGVSFGATIGADMISDMATQFDFYDGGGLDICFLGAMQVDRQGNVNVHRSSRGFVGVGGFANITNATKIVVFCLTFSAIGLDIQRTEEGICIAKEGTVPKVVNEVSSITFSAQEALRKNQQVLYITERCVFGLGKNGLELLEVYEGIDPEKDILAHLDFLPVLDSIQSER